MSSTRKAKNRCKKLLNYSIRSSHTGLNESFTKPECVICLEMVATRGKLSVCDHWFCFACIYEWSKNTNRCPLCKERFRCITKISMSHNHSPPKSYRIKDKNQRFVTDSDEDREVAYALAEETSSDDVASSEDDYDPSIVIEIDASHIEQRRTRSSLSWETHDVESDSSSSSTLSSDASATASTAASVSPTATSSTSSDGTTSSASSCSSDSSVDSEIVVTTVRSHRVTSYARQLPDPNACRAAAFPLGRRTRRRNRALLFTQRLSTRSTARVNRSQPDTSANGWIDMAGKSCSTRASKTASRPQRSYLNQSSKTAAEDILSMPFSAQTSNTGKTSTTGNTVRPRRTPYYTDSLDACSSSSEKENIFNLGMDDSIEVRSPAIVGRRRQRTQMKDSLDSYYALRQPGSNDSYPRQHRIRKQLSEESDSSDDDMPQPRRRKRSRARFCPTP